jgi:pseudouridine kinase
MTIQTEADYRAAAMALIDMGVRRVFLSMGKEGMLAADKNNMYIVGGYPAEVVCTTGAGDSATAAIVWASTVVADSDSLVTAAKAANVVASMTVSVQETNNPDLSHNTVLGKMVDSNMTVRSI